MAHPKRILYVEGNVDGTIGGSYFSLLFLVQGLDRTRYEPTVVFQREHSLWSRFEAAAAVRLVARPVSYRFAGGATSGVGRLLQKPLRLLQAGLNLLLFVATSFRYARVLRRERADLLHLNNSITRTHDWMLAARIAGIPCVVHERGINDRFPFPTRQLTPRLDAVLCISQAVYDNLLARGFAEANLRNVPNGLDPAAVRPGRSVAEVRAELRVPDGARVIGVVGNIREWKGQEVLVRALPAILAEAPDVVCVFVGEATAGDAAYMARIQRHIDEHRLQDHVRFTGYTSQVADYLSAMDVAVHTSITPEPFGRVLLEAMAMRKPVVGSRDGAVVEIVVHGETGYTFTPGDPADLAARILDLLRDAGRRQAFGDAGYQRLDAHFHTRRNIAKTSAIYDAIFASSRG